jgi:hypothetical protein
VSRAYKRHQWKLKDGTVRFFANIASEFYVGSAEPDGAGGYVVTARGGKLLGTTKTVALANRLLSVKNTSIEQPQ